LQDLVVDNQADDEELAVESDTLLQGEVLLKQGVQEEMARSVGPVAGSRKSRSPERTLGNAAVGESRKGHSQRSSSMILPGASCVMVATASWSARKSLPLTVS